MALGCQLPARALDPFDAQVVRVVDGDTVWVLPVDPRVSVPASGTPPRPGWVKLRIEGIDAPEICQAHGEASSRYLERWLLRQRVRVELIARDDYGRWLAWLDTPQGEDVGRTMVQLGHAWSYHHRWSRGVYATEEAAASDAGLGLFADPQAQYPRDFRDRNGSCYLPPTGIRQR